MWSGFDETCRPNCSSPIPGPNDIEYIHLFAYLQAKPCVFVPVFSYLAGNPQQPGWSQQTYLKQNSSMLPSQISKPRYCSCLASLIMYSRSCLSLCDHFGLRTVDHMLGIGLLRTNAPYFDDDCISQTLQGDHSTPVFFCSDHLTLGAQPWCKFVSTGLFLEPPQSLLGPWAKYEPSNLVIQTRR